MFSGPSANARFLKSGPNAPRPGRVAVWLQWLVSWFVGPKAVTQAIRTRLHYNASADAVWNHILFYEEIPERAPLILRALLTHPIRSEGDKSRVGAMIRCKYVGGHLIKRISMVNPPHFLKFDVFEQRLGIESCILARGGSYQIRRTGDVAEIELVTEYWTFLYPRVLWRPLEAFILHQLHKHILRNVRCAIPVPARSQSSFAPDCATSGGRSCTVSQSSSRR
jgi:hypothetical protein